MNRRKEHKRKQREREIALKRRNMEKGLVPQGKPAYLQRRRMINPVMSAEGALLLAALFGGRNR